MPVLIARRTKHRLTHSLNHSTHTHSLTHSLTHSHTHSLTHTHTHSLTHTHSQRPRRQHGDLPEVRRRGGAASRERSLRGRVPRDPRRLQGTRDQDRRGTTALTHPHTSLHTSHTCSLTTIENKGLHHGGVSLPSGGDRGADACAVQAVADEQEGRRRRGPRATAGRHSHGCMHDCEVIRGGSESEYIYHKKNTHDTVSTESTTCSG